MTGFLQLKTLKGHWAGIWSVRWSFYGEFVISSGSDKMVLIWGSSQKIKFKDSLAEKKIKFLYFSRWKCLCKFKLFEKSKTHRSISVSYNRNSFCVSTFSGIFHISEIICFGKSKFVCIQKKVSFFNSFYEIKNCKYSYDNCLILTTTRNKEVWLWKKNKFKFDYFYTLNYHESDVKCLKWCFDHKCFLTVTYEGVLRFFAFFENIPKIHGSVVVLYSIIWNLDFIKNEKEIILCTNRGILQIFIQKKKNQAFFFLLSVVYIFYFSISDHNFCILYTDNEENTNILIKHKFRFARRIFNFYTSISFSFQVEIQSFLKILNSGDTNCITWHPNQNNVAVSCGDEAFIYIWYYTQFFVL